MFKVKVLRQDTGQVQYSTIYADNAMQATTMIMSEYKDRRILVKHLDTSKID